MFDSEYNKHSLPGISIRERQIEKHKYIVHKETIILLRIGSHVKESRVLCGVGMDS